MGAKKAPAPAPTPATPQPTQQAAPAPEDVSNDPEGRVVKRRPVDETLLTGRSGSLGNPSDADPNTRRRSLLGSVFGSGLA